MMIDRVIDEGAGGVLTAKQAPTGPAPLAALGLRTGKVAVTITRQTAYRRRS
jgi:hypothetical protein